MSAPLLEEVFKTSGVPTFTFVEPSEYTRLLVGTRTRIDGRRSWPAQPGAKGWGRRFLRVI
jgi:hypothetical protein